MKQIKTQDLYEAAFYLTYGGKLVRTDGTYPNVLFTLTINRFMKILADTLGIVFWRQFRNKRKLLKRFASDGEINSFTLGEVARIKSWIK